VRVGPHAGDQPAVPAQQRLGFDQEARPAGSGQRAADRGEQGPVSRFQPGTWGLATEDRELVAQDEDLQILDGVAAGKQQHEQLKGATQREVDEFRRTQNGLQESTAGLTLPTRGSAQTSSSQVSDVFAHPSALVEDGDGDDRQMQQCPPTHIASGQGTAGRAGRGRRAGNCRSYDILVLRVINT
jgi:hypothetical protein